MTSQLGLAKGILVIEDLHHGSHAPSSLITVDLLGQLQSGGFWKAIASLQKLMDEGKIHANMGIRLKIGHQRGVVEGYQSD